MERKYTALAREMSDAIFQMEQTLLNTDIPCPDMRQNLIGVISSGGKRLRPSLAYLCYRLGGHGTHPILPLMCMLELMHTASLIHDDVVDRAELRRSAPTINAKSGAESAVRSGDYLLAEAMRYLSVYRGTGINEALVRASSDMCLSELRQLAVRHDITKQTRERYFSQIHGKTASFIAASCHTGALAGGLVGSAADSLQVFGEKLGMAFQLRDDILDFSGRREFGKKPGQDIKNGIFSLPVLYLLESGNQNPLYDLLVKVDKADGDIREIISLVNGSDAVKYTKTVIKQLSDEAIFSLREIRDCEEKSALVELVSFLQK